METGVVISHSVRKTYGFIKPDRASLGSDIFFHRTSLVDGESLPEVGQRVQFYVTETEKGLQANKISVVQEVYCYS